MSFITYDILSSILNMRLIIEGDEFDLKYI